LSTPSLIFMVIFLGSAHYNWMKAQCMGGTAPAPAPSPTGTSPTSTSGLYYPDWEGENNGCVNDGNAPAYIVSNPSLWMFSTLSACCELAICADEKSLPVSHSYCIWFNVF
jgi:hypothetical protein